MKNYFNILIRILKAPKITLRLDDYYYRVCTKPHPKLKIIPNKKYLVALMGEYHRETYEINKSLLKNGNEFRMFDVTNWANDIVLINISNNNRQDKPIPKYMNYAYKYREAFKDKKLHGIFKGSKLIAYCDVVKYGDVNVIGPFMGHADYLKEGIMYHLFDHIALKPNLMYDTFLGNSEGLTYFKKKLGFKEYNVLWKTV